MEKDRLTVCSVFSLVPAAGQDQPKWRAKGKEFRDFELEDRVAIFSGGGWQDDSGAAGRGEGDTGGRERAPHGGHLHGHMTVT